MGVVLAAVALVGVLVWYVTWLAGRVDRLAGRVDAAWAALDAQLVRRAAAAAALAERLGDRELRAAADAALDAPRDDRVAVENALSRALRRAHPVGVEVLEEAQFTAGGRSSSGALPRVRLARQFYNDAVRDLRGLRTRGLPRLLRLGGRRPLPPFFEIDDLAAPRATGPPAGAVTVAPGEPALRPLAGPSAAESVVD